MVLSSACLLFLPVTVQLPAHGCNALQAPSKTNIKKNADFFLPAKIYAFILYFFTKVNLHFHSDLLQKQYLTAMKAIHRR